MNIYYFKINARALETFSIKARVSHKDFRHQIKHYLYTFLSIHKSSEREHRFSLLKEGHVLALRTLKDVENIPSNILTYIAKVPIQSPEGSVALITTTFCPLSRDAAKGCEAPVWELSRYTEAQISPEDAVKDWMTDRSRTQKHGFEVGEVVFTEISSETLILRDREKNVPVVNAKLKVIITDPVSFEKFLQNGWGKNKNIGFGAADCVQGELT